MKKKYFLLGTLLFTLLGYSQCYTKIESGGFHITAQKTDGTIWGWGFADWGQLNSTNYSEPSPIMISPVTDWQFIKNGAYNSFAIKNNGTLWGCGGNTYGCLGIGSTALNSYTLVQIGNFSNWAKIAPSEYFTIALQTNGTLWGWGQNDSYQMGNNTCCANQLTPIQIGADTDWVKIEITDIRTAFAIKSNGTLWGWGDNGSCLLGFAAPNQGSPIPVQINTDTDWASVNAFRSCMLALKNNTTLWSWGGGIMVNWVPIQPLAASLCK